MLKLSAVACTGHECLELSNLIASHSLPPTGKAMRNIVTDLDPNTLNRAASACIVALPEEV